ncbi:MAG: hypothetical protein AAFR67_12640, partial [Chloroflexota bacterium]
EDILVFTSDLYVQVTASVVITSEGVVVIDSLLYPEETQQMIQFITERVASYNNIVLQRCEHGRLWLLSIVRDASKIKPYALMMTIVG